ncbi:class I SAM-dependent methyltransferase [bacterium]|nr:class I SAM-dependent methyltransferase [bacterium]
MQKNLYKELYELENEHWWFIAKRKIISSIVEKYLAGKKHNKILDLGCGAGLMLNEVGKFGKVYGADCSDEAIEFCKLESNAEVRKGCLPDEIPFPDNYFDVVLLLDVLEHIDNDFESLKTVRNLLTEDGFVVLTVPAFEFLWSNHDKIHGHKRRYNINTLKLKLEQAGFKVEKISYYDFLLFFPIAFIRLLDKYFRISLYERRVPNKFFNFLFMRIFSSERFILKHAKMLFGISIIAVVRKKI